MKIHGVAFGLLAFFAVLTAYPHNGFAVLCGDTINTVWTAGGPVTETASDTSFTACTDDSSVSGSVGSALDLYTLSVEVTDADTFSLSATLTDAGPAGAGGALVRPGYRLELTNINWFGEDGIIDDVIDLSTVFDLVEFDEHSITIETVPSFNVIFATCSTAPLCTEEFDFGEFDVVAEHETVKVPEPATLGIFAFGLAVLGVMTRRRHRKTDVV